MSVWVSVLARCSATSRNSSGQVLFGESSDEPVYGGKLTNIYDLSGLVERLKKLEPEFRSVEEEAKASRKAVAKRGYSRP